MSAHRRASPPLRRGAFLTMHSRSGYTSDDGLAVEPLRALGWTVESIPWRQTGVAWAEYDAVVLRSTWDYHLAPAAFLSVLTEIDRSGTRLENPLDLVRWNLHKTYLRDLAQRGVPIVPTLWPDRLGSGELDRLFDDLDSPVIVVKPVVSASATGAYRLDRPAARRQEPELLTYFHRRPLLAQTLAHAVLDEGEYSLVYFNGEYSHAILKKPKTGDFRVQEEHGASLRCVEPDADLLDAGRAALDALSTPPLYARADLVRSNDGHGYWLMELELIEPSLYLRMDAAAPGRLARALDESLDKAFGSGYAATAAPCPLLRGEDQSEQSNRR